MTMMTWKTEKSLLSPPDDVRHVDNYWDLLPVELKSMIVNMLKRQDETTTQTYWKVCFRRVLGQLIYFTHCKHCGREKIPCMSHYDYTFSSSRFMICPSEYAHLVYIYGKSLQTLMDEYWRLSPSEWKQLH